MFCLCLESYFAEQPLEGLPCPPIISEPYESDSSPKNKNDPIIYLPSIKA